MAITRLGISNPAANSSVEIHQANRAYISSVIATNKGTDSAEVDIWVVPYLQDATPTAWFYAAKNVQISAGNSMETFRFPISGLDKIYVRATSANVSFSLNGLYETTSRSSVLIQATQPIGPQAGDIWFDTDNNRILIWNETDLVWEEPTTAEVDDLRSDLTELDARVVSIELGLGIFD